MKARVTVTLKTGILDPQGKAIEGALKSLGVDGVASVRQGKVFDIELSGSDKAKAEAALKDAADKLLGEYRDRELPGRTAQLGDEPSFRSEDSSPPRTLRLARSRRNPSPRWDDLSPVSSDLCFL